MEDPISTATVERFIREVQPVGLAHLELDRQWFAAQALVRCCNGRLTPVHTDYTPGWPDAGRHLACVVAIPTAEIQEDLSWFGPRQVERAPFVGADGVESAEVIREANQMTGIVCTIEIRELTPNVSLIRLHCSPFAHPGGLMAHAVLKLHPAELNHAKPAKSHANL